ncbi:MAG: helix-turn-helix transcriptional regulator [Clostridium perfringens]|nr:helix-turn-helix transcriptional regulator [Clostridium perfringens]
MINDNIKELRENILNLSQETFATEIGLKRNTISLIENGKRNPSDRTINDICYTFNVNEEWLRERKGDVFSKNLSDEQIAYISARILNSDDELLKQTFYKLCKLDKKYLKMVKNVLDTLIDE